MARSTSRRRGPGEPHHSDRSPTTLRIIGGNFRGRKIRYTGDHRTRPMKDRLREAAFNLLGPAIRGKHAVDLFAGTGALGLEALSRGAGFATLIERHFPTADVIRENARLLGVESQSTVFRGDAFVWGREICAADSTAPEGIEAMPWVVFCSPPYAFFRDRLDDLCQLLARCQQATPADSLLVVESDRSFDPASLPLADSWDTRSYPPSQISIHTVPPRPDEAAQ